MRRDATVADRRERHRDTPMPQLDASWRQARFRAVGESCLARQRHNYAREIAGAFRGCDG